MIKLDDWEFHGNLGNAELPPDQVLVRYKGETAEVIFMSGQGLVAICSDANTEKVRKLCALNYAGNVARAKILYKECFGASWETGD